jgi:type IV pilus assembly protein PilM
MEIVSSAIGNLFKHLKIKNKNVATSISGFSVIVKKITVDSQAESELESTIQEEAEQYIPFDINEVNLDFDILSPGQVSSEGERESGKESGERMEVMLVAAKKDIIDDYVSLLQLASLNPAVLDVDAFALQNAFDISTETPDGCYALVNVGAEELGINAIKNGVSLFARDSSYGGSQITEGLMSKFNMSFEDAEKMKLGGTKLGAKERAAMEEIFTGVITEWVQEIKRALDFVSSTYSDETIEQVFVTGGSCRVPGFQKYLKMETDISVAELNPFSNLIIDEKVFDPKYLKHVAPQGAVAVGLALRSIGDK